MISLLLLTGLAVQEPEPAFDSAPFEAEAEAEVIDQLREQLAGLAKAKSYAFRSLTSTERSGMGGGRGGQANRGGQGGQRGGEGQAGGRGGNDRPGQRGADREPGQGGASDQPGRAGGEGAEATAEAAAPAEPQPWEGIYQEGKPVLMKRGDLHVARMGDMMAMKSGEGNWDSVSMRGFGGRGQGGRQQGGGQNVDRQRMRDAMAVRGVRLPHEAMSQLLESVDASQLVREEKLGMVVFHGPLTAEGAMAAAMGGNARRMGGFGRGGQDGPQFDAEGKVRFTFGEGGKLIDVRVEASLSGMMREREFSMKSTTEMRVMKVGEASKEVPKEVMLALADDSEEGEEF